MEKDHLFLMKKDFVGREDKHFFYFAVGTNNKGLTVKKCWKWDREVETKTIPFKHFGRYNFYETTYGIFVKNHVFNTDEKTGWITPEGSVYFCDITDHNAFCYWFFGKEEYDIEKEGYVKVCYNNNLQKVINYTKDFITEKQYNALIRIGFAEKDLKNIPIVH